MVSGPLRHLGKLGCVRSDPYEPTSTGIGVGRGGAATHLYATDLYSDLLARCRWFDSVIFTLCTSVLVREMGPGMDLVDSWR